MNNMNHDFPSPSRIVWLDVVRLTAMLMVIGVHCIDPFYISPTLGTLPEYKFRASVYGSLFRPSVPLFAMMTGLLLLPVSQQPLGVFYKKRIFRVLFPFLIWSVLYNLFPWFTGVVGLPKSIIGDFFCYVQGNESQSFSDSLKDIAMIPFNFSFKENHMWYIYLLIGLYLYMPFFSAWIDKADRKMKQTYLWIWVISLFLPYMGEYISHYLWHRHLERIRDTILFCRFQRLSPARALCQTRKFLVRRKNTASIRSLICSRLFRHFYRF